jgi:hypothetical protein
MNGEGDWHPSAEQLAAFDSGRLHPAEWEEVERHVERCLSCCRSLESVPDDRLTALVKATGRPASTVDFLGNAVSACGGESGISPPTSAGPLGAPAELVGHPRYRVLGPLGAGGMGVVFKAEHRLMDRVIALKVLQRHLTDRPAAVERFRQEVKAAARLSHPNVVAAYDADEAAGTHFLVMELVEGESLDRLVSRCGSLPVSQACELIRQAATGLQYAFEQGMIHRDLKPANLMVTPEGQLKVLDFGLSRFAAQSGPALADTPTGAFVGTPDYVAPEQARQVHEADIRSDIYSLGCTLYYLLTARPPFPDGSVLQKLLAHQDALPRPVAAFRNDLPPGLAAILDRMLAKDPRRRFQTPADMARALEPFAAGESAPRNSPRRRFWLAAGLGLAATALVVLAVVFARNRQPAGEENNRGLAPAGPQPNEATPTPAAEISPAPTARQQMEDWLRRESEPRIEGDLRPGVLRQFDSRVHPGTMFVVRLGPELVRSGKATLLVGRQADLFVLHPGPSAKMDPRSMIFETSAPQHHRFQPAPPVELTSPVIDGGDLLDGLRDIRGRRCRQPERCRGPGEVPHLPRAPDG